jgi:L-threonylcarbamoyladenylate synthase
MARILAPTSEAIAEAAAALRSGELVAFPTETVYGLGADATDDLAVARIFEAKGRPRFNPLIVHVPDVTEARRHVAWNDVADRLASRFWPGALTLVLPRADSCRLSLLCSAGLDTVAIRCPAHPIARALLRATERPLAAPSANRSGAVSPTLATHVAQSLAGTIDIVLDGGPCSIGLESTVLDLAFTPAGLLRPGGVTREAIEALAGPLAVADEGHGTTARRSPGQLESHYAPSRPLRLDASHVVGDEALLAFGRDVPTGANLTLNLSPAGDLGEAAANLFAMLRALDRPEVARIAVMPIPGTGLGLAINDRLRRAATR